MNYKVGTIGTSSITAASIAALKKVAPDVEITVYSRSLAKAQAFAQKHQCQHAVDQFEDLIKYANIIYIASPNGLHYEQTQYFLARHCHVLVEKPITFTVNELESLVRLAKKRQCLLMEAFIPVHLPAFQLLQELSSTIEPRIMTAIYSKVSSRLDDTLKAVNTGEPCPPVFDRELGGGSLYDALIYPVELAVALFGSPTTVKALAQRLPNQVDLANCVLLGHKNKAITVISCSKEVASANCASEISGRKGIIAFNNVRTISNLSYRDYTELHAKNLNTTLDSDQLMTYEWNDFLTMINNNDWTTADRYLKYSLDAIGTLMQIKVAEKKI